MQIEQLLIERLEYAEGHLFWKGDYGSRAKKGSEAGYLHIVRGEYRWKLNVQGMHFLRSRIVFLIHNGRWPSIDKVLDHKDKNTLNDRIENLREVTQSINMETRVYKFGHPHAPEYK